MKLFCLHRNEDETGISGTGVVAEGCQFTDGRVALIWQSALPSGVVHPSIETVEALHGHGGKTKVHIFDEIKIALTPEAGRPGVFFLNHKEDKFGLTRIGTVAECAVFSNRWVATRWLVAPNTIEFHTSVENWSKVHNSQEHCYLTSYPATTGFKFFLDFLSNFRWYRNWTKTDWFYVCHSRMPDHFFGWVRYPDSSETVLEIEAR